MATTFARINLNFLFEKKRKEKYSHKMHIEVVVDD